MGQFSKRSPAGEAGLRGFAWLRGDGNHRDRPERLTAGVLRRQEAPCQHFQQRRRTAGADDHRSADLAYWPKAEAPGGPLGKLAYSPRVRLETRDGYPLLRRDDYRLIPVILRDPKTDLD